MKRRKPFTWYGGKGFMIAKIVPLIPPHKTWVEVFGGSAAITFAKAPSPVEIYNDIDSGLVNFFRVLRDPQKSVELQRLLELTPYSREEFYHCVGTWNNEPNDVIRAYKWFVVARMAFAGDFRRGNWGYDRETSSRGMAACVSKWRSAIERLPDMQQRIASLQVDHVDFRKCIRNYDSPQTCFYCDPPYTQDSRRVKKIYRHELSDDDHRDLIDILLNIEGMAILSGYENDIYAELLKHGWSRLEFKTVCYAHGRTRTSKIHGKGAALKHAPRTECIWMNPRCAFAQDRLLSAKEEWKAS